MEEQEIVARLQERLADQVKECTDLRTLLRVLELLEGPPPQGYGVQEDVALVEEPGGPYWTKDPGGFKLTQAHKDILDERGRQIESGEVAPVSWQEAFSQIENDLNESS